MRKYDWILGIPVVLLLSGCTPTKPTEYVDYKTRIDARSLQLHQLRMATHPPLGDEDYIGFKGSSNNETEHTDDAWGQTRDNLRLDLDLNIAEFTDHLDWLTRNPNHLSQISEQAQPYYYYIFEQVIGRGMPAEVALIPMIESGYNPQATSPSNAAGHWQFMPTTARNFGLKNTRWYDGRRDIIESTDAALNYLNYLNNLFDGDWLLTLAAYNAGEGRVARAIKQNEMKNLPTDFWSLDLPAETMRYIPRLLATARAIRDADDLGQNLSEIPAEPYFTEVIVDSPIGLQQAAELAEVDLQELEQLNAGLSQGATPPDGPHRVLIPTTQAELLQTALDELPIEDRIDYASYTVKSGDTLGGIAHRHSTSVKNIVDANKLKNTQIRVGQTLLIPSTSSTLASKSIQSGSS
ncbi:transglycosylase SLT domain-containing protein [Nitrincola alkalisediminis]|nr:transglycosylase SLT domain-containing protein [Nitrincola alkalisediminis]